MHLHGRKAFKLSRQRDQRRALRKGLAGALIEFESIQTTLPKAKMTLRYCERLITKAKKGDLHNRRLLIARLPQKFQAHKLMDQIAPQLTKRDSGHLRLEKIDRRLGDGAALARLSFVDALKALPSEKPQTKMLKKPKVQAPKKTEKAKV